MVKPETALPAGSVGLDIYLRFATPERYYRVSLSDTAGQLWKRTGHQEQVLLTFPCQLVTGAWQSLAFELVDWQLSGCLDTGNGLQELFVYGDETVPILTGTVGVGLSGESSNERVVRFDDVLVAISDSVLTAVPDDEAVDQRSQPIDLALRIFPNPANPAVTIHYEVPIAHLTRLTIYSVDGRLVATLVNRLSAAGQQEVVWDGTDQRGYLVPSGIYIYHLEIGKYSVTKRVTLIR
jgi:hypothetical protein